MDFSSLYLRTEDIRNWAEQRNLIADSNPAAQYLKLMEEYGELLDAINQDDVAGIKDGIGDMFVVLTILSAQCGHQLERHFQLLIDYDIRVIKTMPMVQSLSKLAAALARSRHDKVMEPILDALCAMRTLAGSCVLNIVECVEAAWAEIKDRKGRMENGVFIKEGD